MVQQVRGTLFCRHLAEQEGTLGQLEALGTELVYVGEPIAEAIREGFMVLNL